MSRHWKRSLSLAFGLLASLVVGKETKAGPADGDPSTEEFLVTSRTYNAASQSRVVKDAAARAGWALCADPADHPGKGYLWCCLYTYQQSPGKIRATFRLKAADNTNPEPVAFLQGDISGTELKGKEARGRELSIRGTDFKAPNTYQDFSIDFLKGELGFAQWGVSTAGVTTVWCDGMVVEQISRFSADELIQLIEPPVKPPDLVLTTVPFRAHETAGLYREMWQVQEALEGRLVSRLPGAERTQSYLDFHSQKISLKGFPVKWEDLYGYSVVVLNNVPAKAVTLPGTLMLKQYVEDGGCLIMMGDTHGLAEGQWAESALNPVLPVTLEKPRDLARPPQPLFLRPCGETFQDLDWAARPCTIYYHPAGVRPGAEILLAAEKIPLVVEGRVGKGRVIVLLTSVLGEKNPRSEGVPFWEWKDWPALMARLMIRGVNAPRP